MSNLKIMFNCTTSFQDFTKTSRCNTFILGRYREYNHSNSRYMSHTRIFLRYELYNLNKGFIIPISKKSQKVLVNFQGQVEWHFFFLHHRFKNL